MKYWVTVCLVSGVSLATSISYTNYRHIGWAMWHGFWSWFYVIYFWLVY